MPARRPITALAVLAVALALSLAAGASGAPSIAGTRAEVRELGREVAGLDVRVGAAAAAQNSAIDRLDAARATLATTRRELQIARSNLARARALLADRLVALYVDGTPSFIELVLQTGSLVGAQAVGELLDQIARHDAGVVEGVRERRGRLQVLEARQTAARAARERELAEAARRKDELDGLLARRTRLLEDARAELKRLVVDERERRLRLRALEAARGAALASLPVAGATVLPGALPAGEYLFPVAGPVRFTNDWLNPRSGGRVHQGIDLFASYGTPVVAVADGSLFNVGYNGLGGWRLWVRDTGGNAFYYAHLSAYAPVAREGAGVSRGTVIGYVGDSGDAEGTSPHLHFEVHPGGGGPVPPYSLVSGWPRAG